MQFGANSKSKSSPLSRCIRAGGSLAAGILLYRIAFWYPKAKVKHGQGGAWVVKTRGEWTDETALSLWQYDRALARLKHVRLIETEQHLIEPLRPVTHLRLTEKGLKATEFT